MNTFPKIFFLKFNPLANKTTIKPKKNMRNNIPCSMLVLKI